MSKENSEKALEIPNPEGNSKENSIENPDEIPNQIHKKNSEIILEKISMENLKERSYS